MKWSEKFNSLSEEHRKIGVAHEVQLRIQHLKMEKDRLKKRYIQSVNEIDLYIKHCEATLWKLEEELTPSKEDK